jgi:hypothetical protein
VLLCCRLSAFNEENAPAAFTTEGVAEEDGEQSLTKTAPFSYSKGCFQFGHWCSVIL